MFESEADHDELSLNWQRLVLTHLKEREHKGVLTGSPITDMKISLVNDGPFTIILDSEDLK